MLVTGEPSVSRRRLLRRSVGGGAVLAAGCLDSSNSGDGSGTATRTSTAGTPTSPTHTVGVDGSTVRFSGGGSPIFDEAIQTAASMDGGTLEIAPGTYRLDGSHSPVEDNNVPANFWISGANDGFSIRGPDATLQFTNAKLGGIHVHDSADVTIEGITIDWAPPPFAQGTIESVSPGKGTAEIALAEWSRTLDDRLFEHAKHVWGYPGAADATFLEGVASKGSDVKWLATVSRDRDRQWYEHLGGSRWRLHFPERTTYEGMEAGGTLAINPRHAGAKAFAFIDCTKPTLRNVTVHSSPSVATQGKHCDELRIEGVTVAPPTDSDRLVSTNSDGIHVTNNATGPTMVDSTFRNLLDDAMVVDTRTMPVTEIVDDRTVRVEDVVGAWVREGDTCRAITPTAVRKGELPAVASVEYRFHGPRTPGRPKAITFESPIAETLAVGDFLLNETLSNDGFALRNNTARNNRARPIRITSGDGVIEGNHVDGCSGSAIELEFFTESQFAPKGWVENVTIQDNVLERVGLAGVAWGLDSIVSVSRTIESTEGRPHENVEIRNNELRENAYWGLDLRYARDVTVSNALVEAPNVLSESGTYGMGFQYVSGLEVADSTVRGTADQVESFAVSANVEDVTGSNNELVIDGESRPVEWPEEG
jgi:hypothetical protein